MNERPLQIIFPGWAVVVVVVIVVIVVVVVVIEIWKFPQRSKCLNERQLKLYSMTPIGAELNANLKLAG